jgi:hypothetical protein
VFFASVFFASKKSEAKNTLLLLPQNCADAELKSAQRMLPQALVA